MRLKALHHVRFMTRECDGLQNFASDFGLVNAECSDARLITRLNAAALLGLQPERG